MTKYTPKYFKPSEFHDFDRMNSALLEELDKLREWLGSSIVITSSTDGVHEPNSQHYLGRAVDIMFPESKKTLRQIYEQCLKMKFMGIGIYPNWKYFGKEIGGLHLDIRETKVRAQWMGVRKSGKQTYIALSSQNLIQYKIV